MKEQVLDLESLASWIQKHFFVVLTFGNILKFYISKKNTLSLQGYKSKIEYKQKQTNPIIS